MSSNLEKSPSAPAEDSQEAQQSKKAAKKAAAKQEKLRRRQDADAVASAAAVLEEASIDDPLSENYGDVDFKDVQSKVSAGRQWSLVESLSEEMKGQEVLFRGWAQAIRPVSKKMAFVVVRGSGLGYTVQCVLSVAPDLVSQQMVKFATLLSRESLIAVNGVVSLPSAPIKGTSQQVEVQVRRIYCINRSLPTPFNIEDAARSESEIEKVLQETGEQLVRVNQDTRLNNRALELRTPANQAIFDLQYEVEDEFRRFLKSEGFKSVHTPKITPGSSEGGAAVFKLDYMGRPACLAQSPQLYKQMAICGGKPRVFEVGPVFRAERSFTHRHLCEFVGLDVEMVIMDHYSEVMDIVDRLFVAMFDHLNLNCKKELEAINKQFPFEPLKVDYILNKVFEDNIKGQLTREITETLQHVHLQYLRTTLRLTFQEGLEMLKEAGVEVDPYGDLSTETERKLGQLVLNKYGTEFYILHKYPLAVRPFYTMPCYEDNLYSNSFDVFIRGEEIISGAQRIHDSNLLTRRAEACGIDLKTISSYIDSFRYGTPPHGGFGVGLERVVMLFCGLNNIRKTSMFPRDPNRLSP